jgi:hypothetical protein
MTRLNVNVNDARCEALFASGLQRSDAPTAEMVAEAIGRTVRQLGIRGCASRMAQEFGDHPEAAAERMRWVRQLASELHLSASPAAGRVKRPQCAPAGAVAVRPAAGHARRAA